MQQGERAFYCAHQPLPQHHNPAAPLLTLWCLSLVQLTTPLLLQVWVPARASTQTKVTCRISTA